LKGNLSQTFLRTTVSLISSEQHHSKYILALPALKHASITSAVVDVETVVVVFHWHGEIELSVV
jgi:hypothetical protein